MKERRRAKRVDVNIPTRWEGATMQHEGTISSLSQNGCFLLTGGKVEHKELVRVEVRIPNEEPLFLWGEVVEEAFDIGFAVRFNPFDSDEHKRLIRFIDRKLSEVKKKSSKH
jgi:PilZ domain